MLIYILKQEISGSAYRLFREISFTSLFKKGCFFVAAVAVNHRNNRIRYKRDNITKIRTYNFILLNFINFKHYKIMINGAKCNLGKVKLETMLASSFTLNYG